MSFAPIKTISSVKFGDGNIMIFMMISTSGTGNNHIAEKKMTACMFQNILKGYDFACFKSEIASQYDIEPKQWAKIMKWFTDFHAQELEYYFAKC